MCECGCVSNDERLVFPGPRKAIYILSLHGGCVECDSPAAITIELIEPTDSLYREYKSGDFIDGKLAFEQWPDSQGVAIKTGMLRSEFIAALRPHLVGVGPEMFGDTGAIDDSGADVILEEAYEDAQVRPQVLERGEQS